MAIIAAKRILDYIESFKFPVDILVEIGPGIALVAYEEDLRKLIEMNAIVGKGSWKTIKHLRLSRPLDESIQMRGKVRSSIKSDASNTTFEETIDTPKITFKSIRHTAEPFNPRYRENVEVYEDWEPSAPPPRGPGFQYWDDKPDERAPIQPPVYANV